MTYIEGFVVAVPTANRQAYLEHATTAVGFLREFGVARMVENWGDDVPVGTLNDFAGAVQATADETVVFSWFEYPDKAARDAANARMMTDPRMEAMGASMPFDGSRMIYAGFQAELEDGLAAGTGYVDGFILPASLADKDAYFSMARTASAVFRDHGARRVVETWGDDVPAGEKTDYARAAHATADEVVVYAWVEWPDKLTRDAGTPKVMADARMQTPSADLPFDGKRAIYGGFTTILDA
ncbi:DUF1428 domain-containing protein [Sphingomonas sp. PP-CE-1A-559]|uniref:DUF1428 domain-containing protein n=1 Tax=Sphingomonas sp. PP-CE-1A-559 TaxID=2135657 RepID=UPI001055A461|nr:DUF1428 domain-containing protein [Sphingomonas sp. PP-CE-1A-559]